MKTSILVACFSNNKGGMELNAMGVAQLLAQQHHVTLVCRAGSYIATCEEKIRRSGVDFVVVPFRGNFSLKCVFAVRRLLKTKNIRNLLFFGASELKSLVLANWGVGARILNFHGTTKTHSKKDPLHALIYKSVTFHLPVSAHIKKNVLNIIPGATDENTRVLHLPCDFHFEGKKIMTSQPSLIHVGRLAEGKGHEDALKVLASLRERGIKAHLSFLGGVEDAGLMERLQQFLQQNSKLKEQVEFAGFTSDVFQRLCAANVLVFPSRGEGLPNTLIESFLAKTLPVTYDNTVFPEFLEMGFDFFQAKDGDIDDLSRCVEEALCLSPELYQKRIEHNYKLARECFSGENILKQYNKLLA